jgi:hypothetical protein
MRLTFLLTCTLALLLAWPAFAAHKKSGGLPSGPSPHYGPGHLAVEGQVGAGAPLGFAGLAGSVDLLTQLAVEVGVGLGRDGPQAGALARFRRVSARWAAGLGVGGSVGPYHNSWGDVTPLYRVPTGVQVAASWHPAWWVNVEGFTEWRDASGVRIRGGLGFAWHLNRADCFGDHAACERMPVFGTFYATIAVGFGR